MLKEKSSVKQMHGVTPFVGNVQQQTIETESRFIGATGCSAGEKWE